jgi:hypothetical protein
MHGGYLFKDTFFYRGLCVLCNVRLQAEKPGLDMQQGQK